MTSLFSRKPKSANKSVVTAKSNVLANIHDGKVEKCTRRSSVGSPGTFSSGHMSARWSSEASLSSAESLATIASDSAMSKSCSTFYLDLDSSAESSASKSRSNVYLDDASVTSEATSKSGSNFCLDSEDAFGRTIVMSAGMASIASRSGRRSTKSKSSSSLSISSALSHAADLSTFTVMSSESANSLTPSPPLPEIRLYSDRTQCDTPSSSSASPETRKSLLVSAEGGTARIALDALLDELFEASIKRQGKVKCTRDSWVQTEKGRSKKEDVVASANAVDRRLAPLASEEEFSSDNDVKRNLHQQVPTQNPPKPTNSELHRTSLPSPLPDVRHYSAIGDLPQYVIQSQVATMPGSRDICGRSVVFLSLKKMEEHRISAEQLAELILYFQSIPKKETMCLGFLVIVDGRHVMSDSWGPLHKAFALIERSAPGTISLVTALHQLSHRYELMSSKYPIFHIKFEPIVNNNQLLQYVSRDQLLSDFGGTFHYEQQAWSNFHEFLDPFISSCNQTGCRLVKFVQDLRDAQLPSVLTNQVIEQQKQQITEILEDPQLRYLEKEGATFLQRVESYRKVFGCNIDFQEAIEKSKMLYKQLKKVVQRLASLADKRLSKLQECMMMKMFEEESSQVLTWLNKRGEETLKRHRTLAETLNTIREQESEFEKFYFLAMRQIERGNDLLEEIPRAKASEKESGISENLKQQLDDFTDRLEDAREKLEDTSRCYQLLDKTYEWALETMRFVSLMKVDSSTSLSSLVNLMHRLEAYLRAHPRIGDAAFEEMTGLASRLNNETLIEQCKTAREKYQETLDLIDARRESLQRAKDSSVLEEHQSTIQSNLKVKPCLWNPLLQHRSASQSYLGASPQGGQSPRRGSVGSYTAFPSTYYPSPSFKERLLGFTQKKIRSEYVLQRGSYTDDLIYAKSRSNPSDDESSVHSSSNLLRGRTSYPLIGNNAIHLNESKDEDMKSASSLSSSSNRNWKECDDELQKLSSEVREQNRLLEEQKQTDAITFRNRNANGSFTSSNSEDLTHPVPVNSHLTRCASCSDFEELLSPKNKPLDAMKSSSNRTLQLIMMEMIQTERDYVNSLGYIIENYVPLLQTSDACQVLRSQRNIVFGNIEKIHEFHSCYFLRELEQCETMPYSVGQCFLKFESQFYLYALYNKNKPKSDALMAEYGNFFFRKKQQELGDKMDLGSYLLKPVQRMGKYALLLKQLLKECPESNSDYYNNLKAAEEMVRFQLRHGNDLLAMDALRDCDVNIKEQGRLLRQGEFIVWQGKSKKTLRHVFLFEDLLLFSKSRRDPELKGHDYYQYKYSMKTSDLGLTAQVGESPSKFEIWFRKCKTQDLYIFQATSAEVRNAWVEEVSGLLWKQAERNRNLRLEEMSSMGIGNKPCLDISPSSDQICDRSISLQQLNKVSRFRNSIAVSSSDNFNNNVDSPRRRPLSVISLLGSSSSADSNGGSTFYENGNTTLSEVRETEDNEKRRSVARQSQCSAESGIFTDLSTSGDSYAENIQRMKIVERSDSVLSRMSFNSTEASVNSPTSNKEIEITISTSSPCGPEV